MTSLQTYAHSYVGIKYIVTGTDAFRNQAAVCTYKPHDSEFG
jgi:hypothetical protein